MRGCEQQAGRPVAEIQYGDPLVAENIEEVEHVVSDLLGEPTLLGGHGIGSTSPSGVEPDVAAESRQAVEKANEARLISESIHGDPQRRRDQNVNRAMAE
jgi:hypothetical protein